MDYYLKYIKYKNKYLLLKGGKIPEIKEHKESKQKYLPLNYSINKLILNKKVIKDGEMPIYNINSKFEYEVNETDILPNIVKNYYLFYNDIITINDIQLPFETLFLENSFNIIFKLYELLTYKYTKIIFDKFVKNIKDEDIILINSINAVIKDNNCDEKIYIDDSYYIGLKKQIKNNIIFLNKNKNKLEGSLDDNHNEVLQLKSEIDKIITKKKMLLNDIIILKYEIEELDKDNSDIEKIRIEKMKEIREITIIIKELNVKINSINRENQFKMNIDKNISDIINFKSIVNNDTYDDIVNNEVTKQIKIIQNIYKKYFNIDSDNNICIGISVKPNILNKYIFINKFRELLEILYSEFKTEDEIKNKILNLYDNHDAFINICDMMELYENTINTSQPITDCRIDGYSININSKNNDNKFKFYIKNEIKLIMELKEFIKHCDIFDNTHELKEFLKIKTSIIFFASFIGAHFNKLTIPKLDNYLFPTNIDNIISNLLNINNDELNSKYIELDDKTNIEEKSKIEFINKNQNKILNNKSNISANNEKLKVLYRTIKPLTQDDLTLTQKDFINMRLYEYIKNKKLTKINKQTQDKYINNLKNVYDYTIQKIKYINNIIQLNEEINSKYTKYDLFNIDYLPKVFKYSLATFQNNTFPDCVESTLLHFVRAIIWDPYKQNYNYDFLPDTSNKELKKFVKNLKIGNENTPKIKNEFNKIIQNKDEFKDFYKKNNDEINYEIKSNISNFKTFLKYLFNIPYDDFNMYTNPNISNIYEDNTRICIEYYNISCVYVFNIYDGHSKVTKNITNPNILIKYTYINLIYLLSSDYINHEITNFNIYDKYIKNYSDKDKELPFYLLFLMLDKDIYSNLGPYEELYRRNPSYFNKYNYTTMIEDLGY
jgi:hypothetical protein